VVSLDTCSTGRKKGVSRVSVVVFDDCSMEFDDCSVDGADSLEPAVCL